MERSLIALEEVSSRYRRAIIVAAHAVVFVASFWLAFALRFDFAIPAPHLETLGTALPIFVLTKLVAFAFFRQYSGWWRYVSLDDLLQLTRATGVALVVSAGIVYIANLRAFPRSVFLLDALVTGVTLAGLRVMIRLVRERVMGRDRSRAADLVRTLVVGTGPSAEALIREAGRNPALGLRVVGLASDDPRHVGTHVGTHRIIGTVEEIPRLVRDHDLKQVVIAVESGQGDLIRRVVAQCGSADVKHQVLPSTEALMHGRVQVSNLREVSLQDLLGRPPVRLQMEPIAALISGETVLVTGAGGSIGSELCRQVASFGCEHLVLLEQAENPLFFLERELSASYPQIRLSTVIADVYDAERMAQVMLEHRPRIVLHAAAHKHVPLMEKNPSEAVKNNIIGTLNIIRAAQRAEVERCVLISTDKAVNPTSVMGASKRVAEMLMQSMVAASSSHTVLCAVRFGNVLGSNGSVIPIFKEQIAAGGPVTVTHPEMRRYFMTIPEATQLVLQAGTVAQGGDIFVLDMGEPVYIVDVARDLIRLSGLQPDVDIRVEFSGIRPGEKLFEELSTDRETSTPTTHERIFRCKIRTPAHETVLDAARRLETLALSGAAPQTLRRVLFEVLDLLENGQGVESISALADNIIPLQERTRSV